MRGVYSKVLVAVLVALGAAFTVAVLRINAGGHDVADSLIYCVMGACTGELGFAAWIHNVKARTASQERFAERWGEGGKGTDNEAKADMEDDTETEAEG